MSDGRPPGAAPSVPHASRSLWWLRHRAIRVYYRLRREFGGPDYFDELDYWQGILRRRPASLFDAHIRAAAFPAELRGCVLELQASLPRDRRPRLLEVGSGPVSILAAGVDEGLLTVVAVDPLARAYRTLRRFYDIPYPIEPRPGRGETLQQQFASASFEIVYSSNALDHTHSPRRCVEQMFALLRPGGFLMLEGFVREGSQGNWVGLHQHDLFPAGGTLVHEDRAGRRTELTTGLPLACVTERVLQFKDRTIEAFGYEVPAGMPLGAPGDWRCRDWYAILFRRSTP